MHCPIGATTGRGRGRARRIASALASLLLAAGLLLAAAGLRLAPAEAATRRAFIVGNGGYLHAPALPNPSSDARALAARLQQLGYVVTLGTDLNRADLLGTFQRFVRTVGADDVVLFYYAGHGMQIGGENYLVPIDADVVSAAEAAVRLAPLNAFLADLSRVARSRIVLLDACRNNPFADEIGRADATQATRSLGSTRGLARVYAGVGSFIAYSTQPGNVALDGTGPNSPFTGALLRHLTSAAGDVHAVMRRVRGDVQKETGETQVPWENSSLVDELGFAGETPTAASVAPARDPAADRTAPDPGRQPAPTRNFHFVTGLDPKGDNFLALRAAPTESATRIATMGPGTLLDIVETEGQWRRVVLVDGTGGWAHGRWIQCCRPAPATPRDASPPSGTPASGAATATAGESCDSLWHRRNAIWHRHGYCFTSQRGQQAFGNAGCSRDQAAARAAMTGEERRAIDAIVKRESELACR